MCTDIHKFLSSYLHSAVVVNDGRVGKQLGDERHPLLLSFLLSHVAATWQRRQNTQSALLTLLQTSGHLQFSGQWDAQEVQAINIICCLMGSWFIGWTHWDAQVVQAVNSICLMGSY